MCGGGGGLNKKFVQSCLKVDLTNNNTSTTGSNRDEDKKGVEGSRSFRIINIHQHNKSSSESSLFD